MSKPEWPKLVHFAALCKNVITLFGNTKMHAKDMELFAYMIGENPIGKCGFKSLDLTKSPIGKEGAKFLAPALAINKSLVHMDLSGCKLGVSGMYKISDAL